MIKPDDIPQDVWDLACGRVIWGGETGIREAIARAIIAERDDFKSKVDVILDAAMEKASNGIFAVALAVQNEREACAQLVQQAIENDGRINNLPELIRSRT